MTESVHTGNQERAIAEAEHIGPDYTGDNIRAKRVAGYVVGADGEWQPDMGGPSAGATRIDDQTDPTLVYIGKAPLAADPSDPVWQIALLDVTSGLIKTWADGDAEFDNVWDDRVSLTYN